MQSTYLNRSAFRPQVGSNVIHPPWAMQASKFVEICKRCDKCIERCPQEILIRGDGGFPEVDFKRGQCTFCLECVDACQTKAYDYFKTLPPHDICVEPKPPWDLTVTVKNNCLSINAIVCRTCGENCDEHAIQFRSQPSGASTPQIDGDKCTGCGQCVYVCPENAISISNRNSHSSCD